MAVGFATGSPLPCRDGSPRFYPAAEATVGRAARATSALRRQLDDLDAAIQLPVLVGGVRDGGALAAETDGGDPAALDALRDQVVAARLRALQRQRLVLLRVPDVVGVARDLDHGALPVLDEIDDEVQPDLRLVPEDRGPRVEVDAFQYEGRPRGRPLVPQCQLY